VSLTERKSGLALIYKVDRRTKEKTEQVIKQLLNSIADKVHTITSDNGKEAPMKTPTVLFDSISLKIWILEQ
jgi:IS30 family transposase